MAHSYRLGGTRLESRSGRIFVIVVVIYSALNCSKAWSVQCFSWHTVHYKWTFEVILNKRSRADVSYFLSRLIYLKGLAHAKIIKKSMILFWLLNMTIWCKHVHRLELQKFLIFSAAHSPVRLDIESKFLISNYWQPCQKLEIREFRLYI